MESYLMNKGTLINYDNFINELKNFKGSIPFEHCIIDNFFSEEVAILL
jgi:hypothetical protein